MGLCTSMRGNGDPPDAYVLLRELLAARGAQDLPAEAAASVFNRYGEAAIAFLAAKLAEEAENHGVAPLIEPMVAWLAQAAPSPALENGRRVFLALAARHRRAAGVREACIDDLLAAFAAVGIPVILLKGAALAHLIYPRPDLRPMVDVDILIEPAYAAPAVAAVQALGYEFASAHSSRLGQRMHHLPVACLVREGVSLSLEIHRDAMSPNQGRSLTMATLTSEPQVVRRRNEKQAFALGHTDMLRHLARHAFEPARRIRLVHLYDLWRYAARLRSEIDWPHLAAEFPDVIVILRLVAYVFGPHDFAGGDDPPFTAVPAPGPSGIGQGMIPLSEIAEARVAATAKLAALFNPPAWWLHGFYGVPPEDSLVMVRAIRHPAMVARWIALRLAAAAT